jgi:Uma2 family endonuclease
MNEHASTFYPLPPETTQAADGMPRRAWTVAEIEAMQAAGIISEDERFELIGGEVVPMQAKGGRHELVKVELNRHFQRIVPDDLSIGQETTLRLDTKNFVEPDFCTFPRAIFPSDMRGHDVLLAVEVADSSLYYDRGRKLGVYAAFGVPEVWVINANSLVTHVYRHLGAEGYGTQVDFGPAEEIGSTRVPAIRMCLARLGLEPL